MKLTEKSAEIFNYVKDNGGRISITELVEALNRKSNSINMNVTDLSKKGLVVREKVPGATPEDKEITYVVITEDADAILAADAE